MSDQKWVLEWSHKQNCFHIQKLEDSLAASQECFVRNRPPLYSVIMVGSKDTCHAIADNHRGRLRGREVPVSIADCI